MIATITRQNGIRTAKPASARLPETRVEPTTSKEPKPAARPSFLTALLRALSAFSM